jgi:hypothetical protein
MPTKECQPKIADSHADSDTDRHFHTAAKPLAERQAEGDDRCDGGEERQLMAEEFTCQQP